MTAPGLAWPHGCSRCGRRLYYAARAARHRWCRPCAATLGVEQLNDIGADNLRERAAALPAWWRWTVYLEHALAWTKSDDEFARLLG